MGSILTGNFLLCHTSHGGMNIPVLDVDLKVQASAAIGCPTILDRDNNPAPTVYVGDRCYWFQAETTFPQSWINAIDWCRLRGGYLVKFETQSEETAVISYINSRGYTQTDEFWTSGKCQYPNDVYNGNKCDDPANWLWITDGGLSGDIMTYTNWDTNEPNPSTTSDKNYNMILKKTGFLSYWGWYDEMYDKQTNFICEFDPVTITTATPTTDRTSTQAINKTTNGLQTTANPANSSTELTKVYLSTEMTTIEDRSTVPITMTTAEDESTSMILTSSTYPSTTVKMPTTATSTPKETPVSSDSPTTMERGTTATMTTTTTTTPTQCPHVLDELNNPILTVPVAGRCYWFNAERALNLQWLHANDWCRSRGGHLVKFETQSEETAVIAYINSQGYTQTDEFWTSGKCQYPNDVYNGNKCDDPANWLWITDGGLSGDVMTYTNWDSNEPNPSTTSDKSYNMVLRKTGFLSYWGWYDEMYDKQTNFICEFDPFEAVNVTTPQTPEKTTQSDSTTQRTTKVTSSTVSTTSRCCDCDESKDDPGTRFC
ncbi:location of vulva defective 1-like [Ptychodera flava]|uniref:location of vulva defective 1-like n=1 Tax=Ptychodera flava TaxID=63121 RepID=UPI003969CD14